MRLHLFETRYRILSQRALEGGGEFAICFAAQGRGFPMMAPPLKLTPLPATPVPSLSVIPITTFSHSAALLWNAKTSFVVVFYYYNAH